MSQELSRRTTATLSFQGVDITQDIRPYLLSLTYLDNEDGEVDDLEVKLQDREGIWQTKWLPNAIQGALSPTGMTIAASLVQQGWGMDRTLECGSFELDEIQAAGPPAVITLRATALSYQSLLRQTKKSRAWESCSLSSIAAAITQEGNVSCLFDTSHDPTYKRVEQYNESDVALLERLCKDSGLSLKFTNGTLVIFRQSDYEQKPPSFTVRKGDGAYLKYSFSVGTGERQYTSCRVRYTDPISGTSFQAIAYDESYKEDGKQNQQLEVYAKVSSIAEAETLAEMRLRLHNKFANTISFTFPGDPGKVAGMTLTLADWGTWDGTYFISQSRHTLSASGYTTQIQARRVLEGY